MGKLGIRMTYSGTISIPACELHKPLDANRLKPFDFGEGLFFCVVYRAITNNWQLICLTIELGISLITNQHLTF